MPETDITQFQKILKLIAHENKFQMIQLLAQGEICVCDIGEKLGIEQSLVSHHLNSLRAAGLIQDRKVGTWVHCSLNKSEFDKLGEAFNKYLGTQGISDQMCCLHDECKCLPNQRKRKKV